MCGHFRNVQLIWYLPQGKPIAYNLVARVMNWKDKKLKEVEGFDFSKAECETTNWVFVKRFWLVISILLVMVWVKIIF